MRGDRITDFLKGSLWKPYQPLTFVANICSFILPIFQCQFITAKLLSFVQRRLVRMTPTALFDIVALTSVLYCQGLGLGQLRGGPESFN